MHRLCLIAAFGSALTAALAGCTGDGVQRAEVSGTVTFNGQPVKEGSINFFPTDGTKGPEAGGAILDGKYHIPQAKGPVVGKHRVELRAFQKTGRRIQDPTAPPGTLTEEIANVFPLEFNTNSTLIRDVQAGKNELPFEIRVE
jgi:hypothetical protein